jgi:hypothetical protein
VVKLVGIIRGSKPNYSNNRYYNTGGYKSVVWWKKLINALVQEDYLEKCSHSFYTVIGMGENELGDSLNVHLPVDKASSKAKGSSKKYKTIRAHLANLHNVSPYMIVNDKVLSNISAEKPQSIDELFAIDGVSNDFICKYGIFFVTEEPVKAKPVLNKPVLNKPVLNKPVLNKPVKAKPVKAKPTKETSFVMYGNGQSIAEIATERGLKTLTIEAHITSKLADNPGSIDKKRIGITTNMLESLSLAVLEVGKNRLRPIKDFLDHENMNKMSYFQIKVGLLLL